MAASLPRRPDGAARAHFLACHASGADRVQCKGEKGQEGAALAAELR